MNPQDPLAGLHPLRAPDLISGWPLAPGWWLLLALIVLAIAVLGFIYYRRYQASAYRRRAAEQLRALHNDWLNNNDSTVFIAKTNALLKSVALCAFEKKDVAAKHGSDWIAFLNQTQLGTADNERFSEHFAAAAYKSDAGAVNCDQLGQCAMAWIKSHKAPK